MDKPEPADYPDAYTEGISKQDYAKVVESLKADPSQARLVFGAKSTTLLHAAAFDGQSGLVELLIKLGADVNAQDAVGWTPLHKAVINRQIGAAESLLRNGADLHVKNSKGMTPMYWAMECPTHFKDEFLECLARLGKSASP